VAITAQLPFGIHIAPSPSLFCGSQCMLAYMRERTSLIKSCEILSQNNIRHVASSSTWIKTDPSTPKNSASVGRGSGVGTAAATVVGGRQRHGSMYYTLGRSHHHERKNHKMAQHARKVDHAHAIDTGEMISIRSHLPVQNKRNQKNKTK
jgi:hypothetical protein